MTQLNKTPFTLRLRRGLQSAIIAAIQHWEGEPGYATDTKRLFISDGTAMQPVQTLDMAVCFNDGVVCLNDEIVFLC
jgi:hypothetical protein